MSDTEKFKDYARLYPVVSDEDIANATRMANLDQHGVVLPSHVVRKHGQVAGHFSINTIPLWQGHLRKGMVTPHDTFRLIHAVELLLQARGCPLTMTLVGKESGLHKHMGELDYTLIGNADVFTKKLL